jgi:uncharacterized protein (DUF486 family)
MGRCAAKAMGVTRLGAASEGRSGNQAASLNSGIPPPRRGRDAPDARGPQLLRPVPPETAMTLSPAITPIALLVLSNVFMTFAWYGHLKFKATPLLVAILASWGIAFFEYCLAVPANRIGHEVYTTVELKTMQEVITLAVFAGFSFIFLNEPLGWNHAVGFCLIALGAYFVFQRW